MRWLIRRVTKKSKGAVAYEEDIHYGDVLTVGRGSDQAIFVSDIRVGLEHARITAVGGGQYKVESLIVAGIRVNNEITYATTVGPGAVIDISTTRIQLLEPPVDFDAGVEVSIIDKAEIKAEKDAKALPTSLSQTWLSRRMPSWMLFLATALLFVLLPMAAHFVTGLGTGLRAVPAVPSPDSWQAGDLASAHHFFGGDCKTCHTDAFKWVKDAACAKCHSQTPAHADPVKFNVPELGDARCAHCHRDHNGVAGLIWTDQVLCDDCHKDLKARTKDASALADVADFGNVHPEFSINLPAWDDKGVFKPVRTSLAAGKPKEVSGLKFPHDVHLDADGVDSPNERNKKLECESCHKPDAGGLAMQPVDFETMCQECHALTFSILGGDRQVPHAKVAEVSFEVEEFYAKIALEGGINDVTAPMHVQTRRRPGQPPSTQERNEALGWARDKARQSVESLFTGKACSTCHAVFVNKETQSWDVKPVRVAGIWYAKSHFTHQKHATMACVDCHDAKTSKTEEDVLIPGIDNCRQCHGGEASSDKVPTTCIDCHGYHEHKGLLLSELQGVKPTGSTTPVPAAPAPAAPAPAAEPATEPATPPATGGSR